MYAFHLSIFNKDSFTISINMRFAQMWRLVKTTNQFVNMFYSF